MKIKKVQKKIAKYTKKLEKYLDLLAELTAAKEIVAEAAMEKAKIALPDKPVEAPAAEPALVEAPAAEQPKPIRRWRATSSKKPAPEATVVEQSKPTGKRRTKSDKEPVPEPAPVEATPEAQPKPTRRRRATSAKKSAAEGTPVEQPARKRRTPAKKPEILEAYKIYPDHLFLFEFENGDFTDSASPLGPMNDGIGNVPIETKIKDRNMEIGEEMKFVYDFSSNWSRKVKLIEKL